MHLLCKQSGIINKTASAQWGSTCVFVKRCCHWHTAREDEFQSHVDFLKYSANTPWVYRGWSISVYKETGNAAIVALIVICKENPGLEKMNLMQEKIHHV